MSKPAKRLKPVKRYDIAAPALSPRLPDAPFTEEALQVIAQVLDKPLSPALCGALQAAARRYLAERHSDATHPRRADIRDQLEAFRAHLDATVAAYDLLDQRSLEAFSHITAVTGTELGDLHKLVNQMRTLEDSLFATLRAIPKDKGGPFKEHALRVYIHQLIAIYEHETGEEAGRSYNNYTKEYIGPFVSFVVTCLELIEPARYTNKAVGQHIARLLQDIRKPASREAVRTWYYSTGVPASRQR